MKRYFEIIVCEGDFRASHRWDDEKLRAIKIPLGELLEKEIEELRQSCVKARGEGA